MKKLHKEEKCLEYCDLVLIHEAKIKEQNVLLNEIIRDCAKINKLVKQLIEAPSPNVVWRGILDRNIFLRKLLPSF